MPTNSTTPEYQFSCEMKFTLTDREILAIADSLEEDINDTIEECTPYMHHMVPTEVRAAIAKIVCGRITSPNWEWD